jgi:hypothetical protein
MQITTEISGGCRPVDSQRVGIHRAISISVGGYVEILALSLYFLYSDHFVNSSGFCLMLR